ncbi:MAG: hypothetical protein HYX94_03320 [Chloroflexi bacterium]|nr:hypothetical protein [Chloroflexota bacterium]
MCSGLTLNILGVALAAIGSLVKGRRKTYLTLGLVLNTAIIVAMIGLFILAIIVAYDVDLHPGR